MHALSGTACYTRLPWASPCPGSVSLLPAQVRQPRRRLGHPLTNTEHGTNKDTRAHPRRAQTRLQQPMHLEHRARPTAGDRPSRAETGEWLEPRTREGSHTRARRRHRSSSSMEGRSGDRRCAGSGSSRDSAGRHWPNVGIGSTVGVVSTLSSLPALPALSGTVLPDRPEEGTMRHTGVRERSHRREARRRESHRASGSAVKEVVRDSSWRALCQGSCERQLSARVSVTAASRDCQHVCHCRHCRGAVSSVKECLGTVSTVAVLSLSRTVSAPSVLSRLCQELSRTVSPLSALSRHGLGAANTACTVSTVSTVGSVSTAGRR